MSDGTDPPAGAADSERPVVCPVCGAGFESVSVHDEGLLVNVRDNDRYGRVCLEPIDDDGTALVRFFGHTHDQAGTDQPGSAGGRIP